MALRIGLGLFWNRIGIRVAFPWHLFFVFPIRFAFLAWVSRAVPDFRYNFIKLAHSYKQGSSYLSAKSFWVISGFNWDPYGNSMAYTWDLSVLCLFSAIRSRSVHDFRIML